MNADDVVVAYIQSALPHTAGTVLCVSVICMLRTPGTSILAIDPGGTTGIALWDAWDGKLYVDHIDAGGGYFAREWVWHGRVESWARRNAEVKLELEDLMAGAGGSVNRVKAGRGRGKGVQGELAVIDELETGCMNLIEAIILAAGPKTILVWEDFVLGWGEASRVKSTSRDSIAPVRLQARLADRLRLHGLINGDAWRTWSGHGWRGADARGWQVTGEVPEFGSRLRGALYWLVNGKSLRVGGLEDEAIWGGTGVKVVYQMPHERLWLQGGVERHYQWLKERGLYDAKRAPHGADATLHLQQVARKIGVSVPGGPNRIWLRGGMGRSTIL